MEKNDKEILNLVQALKFLGTTKPTLYRWLKSGKLKGVKAGQQWRFYKEGLMEFLHSKEKEKTKFEVQLESLVDKFTSRLKEQGFSKEETTEIINKAVVVRPGNKNTKKIKNNTKSEPGKPDAARILNYIVMEGLSSRASDIHMEIFENKTRLRYRIDGVLKEVEPPSKELYQLIIGKFKELAGLDLLNKTAPQSGRFEMNFGGRRFVVKVNILPTFYGEAATLIPINADAVLLKLDQIDFSPENYNIVRELLNSPNGLIVFAGPAGSGKTTTMYAAINSFDSAKNKIFTIENPVEYAFYGLSQIQVDQSKGFTYLKALKAVMKNDPDVVMLNEITDKETAGEIMETVLTGHLVLTQLSEGDASAALVRLAKSFGLEANQISSGLAGIIGQRLVRKVCQKCKEKYTPEDRVFKYFGKEPGNSREEFFKGKGCEECGGTGFRGRTTVHDIILMNAKLKEAVESNIPAKDLRRIAMQESHCLMKEDGWQKALLGKTTLEEVMKMTKDI